MTCNLEHNTIDVHHIPAAPDDYPDHRLINVCNVYLRLSALPSALAIVRQLRDVRV